MDLIVSLLVVPLEALQESEYNSVGIIIFRWDSQTFDLKEVPEVSKMCLFSFTKSMTLKK